MDRGLYAAASGGLLNLRRLEVLSNNLANVNTVGFKRQRLVSSEQQFEDTLASQIRKDIPRAEADHDRTPGVVDIRTMTDFSQGPVSETGNPLNVALSRDNNFFVVDTPEGEAYTRAGNFTLGSGGQLVTQDGLPVLGDGGEIIIPPGSVQILGDGAVVADGTTVGAIRVVEIDNPRDLVRQAGTRFLLPDGKATQVTPELVPGAVELPNVNAVEAMVEMISAQRAFEAYTKTTRSIDDMNERAIRSATQR